MLKQLLYSTVHRLVDWLTRRRSVGTPLMKYGAVVVVATLGMDYLAQVSFRSPDAEWSAKLATGQGLPAWLVILACGAGLLSFIVGGLILFAEFRREHRQRLVVVELRGLHTSPDTPAKDAVLPDFRGQRLTALIDFRPQGSGAVVDPAFMLEKLNSIGPTVQSLAAGADKSDVHLAVGGLAAVPALFLAGMIADDESHVTVFDWDRNLKAWRAVEGPDDGDRFLPLEGLDTLADAPEAILVVEASYPVNRDDISKSFDSRIPVVGLRVAKPLADRFWSLEKQSALTLAFRDAVQTLMSHGVKKVHLALVAPASLCIRFGMAYDKRLMPEIVVYQFERTQIPPYPWGVEMPTHGRLTAVARPPSPLSA